MKLRPAAVAAAAIVASVATAHHAHAAAEGRITWSEHVEAPELGDSTYTKLSHEGDITRPHAFNHRRSAGQHPVANTRAFVDPQNARAGAYAISDTTYRTVAVPGGLEFAWHNTHTRYANVDVQIQDRLTVTAGSTGLQHGDQVALNVKVRLHGVAAVGNPHINPGSTSQWAWGEAGFAITQQTWVENDETGEGYYRDEAVARAFATAEAQQSTNWYAKTWDRTFSSEWEAWSNTLDDAIGEEVDEHTLDFGYPWDPSAPDGGWSNGFVNANYVSSIGVESDLAGDGHDGYVMLSFLTTVGAELDLSAAISLRTSTWFDSSWAEANFLNTANFDITAAAGYEGLGLVFDSATVPEPASLTLLSLGALLATRRRRREA